MKSHADLDNYSRQLNPEDDTYWKSRGYSQKPANWVAILASERLKCVAGKVVPM
jgi:hypothetical protein